MLAKRSIEGDQYDATTELPFPKSVLKVHFQKEFDNLTQTAWRGSDKGRDTFEVVNSQSDSGNRG